MRLTGAGITNQTPKTSAMMAASCVLPRDLATQHSPSHWSAKVILKKTNLRELATVKAVLVCLSKSVVHFSHRTRKRSLASLSDFGLPAASPGRSDSSRPMLRPRPSPAFELATMPACRDMSSRRPAGRHEPTIHEDYMMDGSDEEFRQILSRASQDEEIARSVRKRLTYKRSQTGKENSTVTNSGDSLLARLKNLCSQT